MAKPNKKRSSSLTQSKYFRTGALALVGVAALGGAFAATSGDLVYGGRSLLAQVAGTIDTTPRLSIVRSDYTPSGNIWSGAGKTLAEFDVNPKYLSSYGYLRSFTGSVHTDSKTAGLFVGNIAAQYLACEPTCYVTKISLGNVTASTTSKGLAYYFKTEDLPLPSVGPTKTGKIVITGHPYYGSIYNNPASPLPEAKVKAQIDSAYGAGQICTTSGNAQTCSYSSVPVYTKLAYGNWLKVNRPTGFGYGYWDLNNNGSLTAADSDLLLKVAVQTFGCPVFKRCDINGSGSVTSSDATMLLKYAVGSLPPPGTGSTTPAVTVSTKLISTKSVIQSSDQGLFEVQYQVTAKGGAVYVPMQASSTAQYYLYDSVNMARPFTGNAVLSSSLTTSSNLNYVISDGQTATFTFRLTAWPAAAGTYRLGITALRWGVGNDSTPEETTAVDYKTDSIALVVFTEY